MADFAFELVSPEKLLFAGSATQIVAPGSEGDFGVLHGHAAMIVGLRAGILTIYQNDAPNDATDQRIFVAGGVADVTPSRTTILAEEAVPVAELDKDTILAARRTAENDLAMAAGSGEEATIVKKINILDAKLAAIAA